MRKVLLFALVAFVLACQDSKDRAIQNLPLGYDKSVGEQISIDVANKWVRNIRGSLSAARGQSQYSVSEHTLAQLLDNNEGPGVVFHNATDDTATHHILMSTLNSNGALFTGYIFDLSSGATLNSATAQIWTKNYADAYPAIPLYHFFANDIFSTVQSNEAIEYVDIVRALNDENEEQILLFVYNSKVISGGRTQGENVTVYAGLPQRTHVVE
jgi:hypothetical protein